MINFNLIKIVVIIIITIIFIIVFIITMLPSDNGIITLTAKNKNYKKKIDNYHDINIANTDIIYNALSNKNNNEKIIINPAPEEPLNISEDMWKYNVDNVDNIDNILNNIISFNHQQHYNMCYQKYLNLNSNFLDSNFMTIQHGKNIDHQINIMFLDHNYKLNQYNIDKSIENSNKGYMVQLSLARSEEEALKILQEIQQKNSHLLITDKFLIKKIDRKDDYAFYSIMLGPYQTFKQAKMICKKIVVMKKQNCIILKEIY